MPDIKFSCPHCSTPLETDDQAGGMEFECPACKRKVTVPLASATSPPLQTVLHPPVLPKPKQPHPLLRFVLWFPKTLLWAPLRWMFRSMSMNTVIVDFTIPDKVPFEAKATRKQKRYLYALGVLDVPTIDALGKEQASNLINQMLAKRSGLGTQRTFAWVLFFFLLFFVAGGILVLIRSLSAN